MMRRCLTIGLLLCCAGALAADRAYRWVDEDGVVHYSDRPQPGAEEVPLDRVRGSETPPSPEEGSAVTAPVTPVEPADDNGRRYETLEIVQPAQEEVLWNIGGTMDVTLRTEPRMRSGHRIRVTYDGRTLDDLPEGSTSFQISEVWRGEHTLQAAVVDAEGRVLIESDTITFYVQQSTLHSPQRQR